MKMNKLQKKILIGLLFLCFITPVGILLPMAFHAGDAWGEWSAQTLNDLIGYVPKGLERYAEVWNAPLSDYTVNADNTSVTHQSGYYLVCGIAGATITYVVMLLISGLIIRNER